MVGGEGNVIGEARIQSWRRLEERAKARPDGNGKPSRRVTLF